MPTFEPFRFFGAFPKPATKQSVLRLGEFGGTINSSTLNEAKYSIPFWWLLYKVSFSVEWEVTTDDTFSGSFGVEFLVNQTSPNERYCAENLLLYGAGEFTGQPPDQPQAYDKTFSVEPFQCELVHVLFNVFGEEVGTNFSGGFTWYITSAPPLEYSNDQTYNLSNEELTVDLPDGNSATLNKCVDFFDADYDEISATSSISDVEFEWYELE